MAVTSHVTIRPGKRTTVRLPYDPKVRGYTVLEDVLGLTTKGVEPILRLIGDLPVGTPVAFEAAFGWGWLVELLEDYGFGPHLVHPSR